MAGPAKNYLYEKNIPQLFESLMTALIFHKPDEPIDFLQSCLDEARNKKGRYTWNCFVEPTKSRAVFSKNKPLPPIKESEGGGANKNRRKCGEESSTAKQQHIASKSENVRTDHGIQSQAKSLESKPLIFVLGGPGSGKGTQCEKIVEEFHFTHLSVGDLLRETVASGSPQGHSIEEIMKEGKLVPPEVTVSLLKSAVLSKPDAVGYLVDGFPRELSQVSIFEKQVCGCSAVLVFQCSEQVMFERLRKRGEVSGRVDDNDETIRKRLHTFSKSTLPVIQHYQALGKVKMMNADRSVEEVYCDVQKTLQQVIDNSH